jgi:hypothetical protein
VNVPENLLCLSVVRRRDQRARTLRAERPGSSARSEGQLLTISLVCITGVIVV